MWFFTRSIRDRFNGPHPAEMAILVVSPSCATAFPNLHSPVIAVGRNCKNKRNRCRNHHSAQHSNQKYASHFVFNVAAIGLLLPLRVRQILLCHSGAVLCSLFCTSVFPTLPFYKGSKLATKPVPCSSYCWTQFRCASAKRAALVEFPTA